MLGNIKVWKKACQTLQIKKERALIKKCCRGRQWESKGGMLTVGREHDRLTRRGSSQSFQFNAKAHSGTFNDTSSLAPGV